MDVWDKDSGLIMATLAGSHLYGTNTPTSDVDIRGICFPPSTSLLGLQGFDQFQPKGSNAEMWSVEQGFPKSDDVTIYALAKFFSLCLKANPNIIELLFAPEPLYYTWVWSKIVENRDLFLSTKIVHSFAGYAYSQLHRIQRHKKWLDNPPSKPNPYDFGLVDNRDGSQDWTSRNQKNAYENKLKEFHHFEEWRKNRNPKRTELERLYNYDSKHGAHLYRLLCEAEELLVTGHLTLPLQKLYRDGYYAVLHGEVSYEEVVRLGQTAKGKLQELEKVSALPKRPDRFRAELLLIELHREWLRRK